MFSLDLNLSIHTKLKVSVTEGRTHTLHLYRHTPLHINLSIHMKLKVSVTEGRTHTWHL